MLNRNKRLMLVVALMLLQPAYAYCADVSQDKLAESWAALNGAVELHQKCGNVNPAAYSITKKWLNQVERKLGKEKIKALREELLRPGSQSVLLRLRDGSCDDEDLKYLSSWLNESYQTYPEQWHSNDFTEVFANE